MAIGVVDTTLYSAQPLGQNDSPYAFRSSFCGPIEVGGSIYLVLGDNQRPSGATFAILVYKSTDDGVTWNLVSGTTQLTSVFYQWHSVGYDAPRIWVLYSTASGFPLHPVLHVVAFNTDTDTWETPLDMTTPSAGTDLRVWDLTVQSDGVLTIIYTIFEASPSTVFNVWYVRYDGSWGTHTLLSSSNGTEHSGLFLDPATDTTHVFYTGRDIFGTGPLTAAIHQTIDSSGSLGSETQLLPAPATIYEDLYPTLGVGCIWNDQIILPYYRGPRPVAPRHAAVFIGTPVSAPVWTSVDLPVNDPTGRLSIFEFAHSVAIVDQGSNLNVFWGAPQWDVDFNVQSPVLMQSINSGSSFATATVYYDGATDPSTPPADTTFQSGVFMPSVALLSTGFGMTFQIVLQTPSFGYSAQPNLYFIASSGATFIPWRVIVDLYGDTQLSAIEPAGTPLAVIT